MDHPTFEITKRARFDAAHFLPNGPEDSPYRRMHGHSFEVEASIAGPAHPTDGWVEDLGALDAALRETAASLDHSVLNAQPDLETPTLERLCLYFAERLRPRFASLSRVRVSRPTIGETCELDLRRG